MRNQRQGPTASLQGAKAPALRGKASPPPPWLSHCEVHALLAEGSALAMGLCPSPSPSASLTVDENNADHGKDEEGKRVHGDFHHDRSDQKHQPNGHQAA